MSVFNAPTGSPSKKPASVHQYPDFPNIGGMTARSTPKNSMTIKRPGSAGTRSSPGTK